MNPASLYTSPDVDRVPSYLVALRLAGRRCLVVGGGTVAAAKAEGLLGVGASVTIVAPRLSDAVRALPVSLVERAYTPQDLEGCWLAVAATGIAAVDRAVYRDGEARNIFVNAADDVAGCSFFLPALLRRPPVTVAVSTDGASPALAAVLRDRIAPLVGEEAGRVGRLLSGARAAIHARGASTEHIAWRPLVAELLDAAAAGEDDDALAVRLSGRLGETSQRGPGAPAKD